MIPPVPLKGRLRWKILLFLMIALSRRDKILVDEKDLLERTP